jgi:hypothetical protein
MTLLEKLNTYAQASDLLLSIPDFGWPSASLCHSANSQTEKVNGFKTMQAWYLGQVGWTLVVMESWDEDGERKSSKSLLENQTSNQVAAVFGES